jgi:hypothetical protein
MTETVEGRRYGVGTANGGTGGVVVVGRKADSFKLDPLLDKAGLLRLLVRPGITGGTERLDIPDEVEEIIEELSEGVERCTPIYR